MWALFYYKTKMDNYIDMDIGHEKNNTTSAFVLN